MNLYITFATFAAVYLIEVFHDDILRTLNGIAKRPLLSAKWHTLDWTSHALLAVLTGFLASTGTEFVVSRWIIIALYAVGLGSMRVLLLNIGLNLKCKTCKWNYLSQTGIDGIFKKIPTLYYALCLLVLITSFYLIYRL